MFKLESHFNRVLFLIIAVQACLLASSLQLKSFTADECYELRNLSLDPIKIANDGDGFPPLFRWLLSISINVTGEPLARAMPMLTSLLGTWVIAITGKRLTSNQGGLIAALFFALSACQLEYAQQLRAYSLYILCVACMVFAYFRLMDEWKNRFWILLVATSSLSLLTHYFATLIALVLWGSIGLVVIRQTLFAESKERLVGCSLPKLLIAGFACLFMSIPFLYSLQVDLAHPPPAEVVNPVDFTSIAYLYLSLAQGWCVGPSSIDLQALPFRDAIKELAPWAILSFGASASLILRAYQSSKSFEWWILVALLTIPTLIAISLSLTIGFSFVSRYLACLVVPVALLVGMACGRANNRGAFLALTVLLVVNGLSFYNRNWHSRYDKENYRLVVERIKQLDQSPRVLVLSHYISHAMRKASPEGWQITPIRFYSDDPPDSGEMDATALRRKFAGAWVVSEWFPADSDLAKKKAELLRDMNATFVSMVYSNLELHRIATDEPGLTLGP